ncbi:hypothetical protein E3N88_30288 [Mikania micrantha]|uniref:Uncharacterized protein n=1 Tax=Mikania micrantha TaxID=192012 RepID=A0A5N6LAL8_9ASTR|nr:hypothetical protein E3N88_44928 [Mikania micrantha]KAD3641065.1 hypothetical protein E3N88_30288 [Mikania micrantha]
MEQHHQKIIEDSGFAPSFSYYSSDGKTSTAIAKVIREEDEEKFARIHENGDVEGDDFEFSLVLSDDEVSIDTLGWTVFPVSDRHLLVTDREINKTDASSAITDPLEKLFIGESEDSSSYSSSEADELDIHRSGRYCLWRPKADGGSSPLMNKCKKSSSTGSGSKRWIFRYLLRRTNSEGKQPTALLSSKKADTPKQKRNSGEVSKIGRRWKPETPVHEQFYVQKRAENEFEKRKTYLPYRKDLVGLFANVNGMGKMLSF